MKKALLFLSAAVVLSFAADAAPSRQNRREARKAARMERRAQKTSDFKWLPGKVENFSLYDGAWQPGMTTEYKYSENGLLLETYSGDFRTVYEYNEDGQEISRTDYLMADGRDVPQTKYVREYDSVVKDFEIYEADYSYDQETNTFVLSSAYKTNITRDAAGNVTQVQDMWYDLDTGEFEADDNEYYTVEYSGGKASAITLYADDEYTFIKDIIWESTDGQILECEYDDDGLFSGANRIKSATVVDCYYNNSPMKLTAEYTDAKGSYKTTLTMGDMTISSLDYKVIDDNGSYEEDLYELDFDYDDETGTFVPDKPYRSIYKEYHDNYGLDTYCHSIDYKDGEYSYESLFVGKVTYDPEHGYPTVYESGNSVSGSSEDDVEFTFRQVFSNYVKVAGVADITIKDADAPVEYFNLQGIRVTEPANGFYIRRQGSKTDKVFIR